MPPGVREEAGSGAGVGVGLGRRRDGLGRFRRLTWGRALGFDDGRRVEFEDVQRFVHTRDLHDDGRNQPGSHTCVEPRRQRLQREASYQENHGRYGRGGTVKIRLPGTVFTLAQHGGLERRPGNADDEMQKPQCTQADREVLQPSFGPSRYRLAERSDDEAHNGQSADKLEHCQNTKRNNNKIPTDQTTT